MRTSSRVFAPIALTMFLSASAFAAEGGSCPSSAPPPDQQTIQTCKKTAEKSIRSCKAYGDYVRQQSDQAAAALARQFENNDQISRPGEDLSTLTRNSSDAYKKADNYCADRASECSRDCKPDKAKSAQGKQGLECYMKKCEHELGAMRSQLQTGAATADDASKQSGQTGQQSQGQGQPPPPQQQQQPQPQPQPSPPAPAPTPYAGSPTPTPSPAPSPEPDPDPAASPQSVQADCKSDQAYAFEQCTEGLEQECGSKSDYSSARCSAFAARYCSTDSGGGEASPGASKPGAGVSSSYCKGRLAQKFCAGGGRSVCPSCGSRKDACLANPSSCMSGASAAEIDEVKRSCGGDPLFADPSFVSSLSLPENANALSAQSLSGGAGASGGGGSSAGSPSASSASLDDSAKKEEGASQFDPNKIGGGSEGGGGGGGGGGYGGGSYGSSESDPDPWSTGSGNRAVAGLQPTAVSGSTEVVNRYGPSLFTIGSEVLRNRCMKGLFLHCERKK